jgi:4-alpha-glucanotransferase
LPYAQRQNLLEYLKVRTLDTDKAARALIELAWASPAALAIAPLQDLLNLGAEARMNIPGRAEGNWAWRCTSEKLVAAPFDALADLTRRLHRAGSPAKEPTVAPPQALHEVAI